MTTIEMLLQKSKDFGEKIRYYGFKPLAEYKVTNTFSDDIRHMVLHG